MASTAPAAAAIRLHHSSIRDDRAGPAVGAREPACDLSGAARETLNLSLERSIAAPRIAQDFTTRVGHLGQCSRTRGDCIRTPATR